MKDRRIELSVVLNLAWLIVLSYLCLKAVSGPPLELPYVDKLGHFCFFLLGGFCLASLPLSRMEALLGLLLLFAVGGFLEVLQSLTGFRQAEWGDLIADALGAAFGVFLMRRILRFWRAKAV